VPKRDPIVRMGFKAFAPAPPNSNDWISSGNILNLQKLIGKDPTEFSIFLK
jgi:hypothetical protein